MDLQGLLLLILSMAGPPAFAGACHVSQTSTSAQMPAVVLESCYEFTGMPAESINWSCSNEANQPQGNDKQKVARCKSGAVAMCTAALTQESLANPRSTGNYEEAGALNVPEDAKVITYFYTFEDRQQAKRDCENGNGTWKEL